MTYLEYYGLHIYGKKESHATDPLRKGLVIINYTNNENPQTVYPPDLWLGEQSFHVPLEIEPFLKRQ